MWSLKWPEIMKILLKEKHSHTFQMHIPCHTAWSVADNMAYAKYESYAVSTHHSHSLCEFYA